LPSFGNGLLITGIWVVTQRHLGQIRRMTRFAPLRLIALVLCLALTARASAADQTAALTAAMTHATAQDWDAARAAAAGAGPIGMDIVEWSRLRAGQGVLGDYESFLKRHPDWPGLPLLKEKGEVAVARSQDPARIIAYFGRDLPRTGAGSLALIRAFTAQGRPSDAEAEAVRGWTTLKFTAPEQADLLARHAAALQSAHEVRLDRILWDGERADEGQRMLPLVSKGWAALAAARMALRADKDGVSALVNAVPEGLKGDPGLAYERFLFRMRRDNFTDAAALIIERTGTLGDPAPWADRRASLARYLMRNDAARDAYRVASSHGLTEGGDYGDLEFLSGYIALRKLNDPARALKHFAHLQSATATPISQARAFYWTARAQAALGDPAKATAAYQRAAQFQTSYYGLLAAEKLGLTLDPAVMSDKRPAGNWKTASFTRSSVFDAARRLYDADQHAMSARFMLHLGESLTDAEFELLADFALQSGHTRTAVLIAKAAIDRGKLFARPYFPVPDSVPDGLAVSRALALSIARRESEFDPKARSSANALGLMQVLPETAKRTAAELGLEFSVGRLTSDPAFNVRIGAAYLRKMADEFGPSIALIASGYNAGPGRPRAWIAAFGDPRLPSVDVVDWVETIPFTETRTYVMRVVEGVVIYRAKLKGVPGPVRITSELTGR